MGIIYSVYLFMNMITNSRHSSQAASSSPRRRGASPRVTHADALFFANEGARLPPRHTWAVFHQQRELSDLRSPTRLFLSPGSRFLSMQTQRKIELTSLAALIDAETRLSAPRLSLCAAIERDLCALYVILRRIARAFLMKLYAQMSE